LYHLENKMLQGQCTTMDITDDERSKTHAVILYQTGRQVNRGVI
jgi:hypothetical protein